MKKLIIIDNEVVEIENHFSNGFGGYIIECSNGCEYHIFEDHHAAGEAARDYWRDMVENDPQEFRCIIGDENLIKWCLGLHAGPGSTQVESLNDWLDLWLDTPEEQWASYDGEEIEGAKFNKHFENEFDFDRDNIVLYRCN